MVCEMYDILVGLSHWFQAMTGTSSVEMVKVRRMDPRTAKETQWEWALITTDATFSSQRTVTALSPRSSAHVVAGENVGVAYTRQQKPHLWLALGGYRETELSQMLYPRKGFGLFPIVGIDTSSKISFNFGQKPFMFDVSGYDRQLWAEFSE